MSLIWGLRLSDWVIGYLSEIARHGGRERERCADQVFQKCEEFLGLLLFPLLPEAWFTIVILVLSSRRRRKVIFGIVLRKAGELQLEKRVNEVKQYYLRKGSLQPTTSTEKDRDTQLNTITKQQQDASHREASAAKKMRDLLNMFFHNLQRVRKRGGGISLCFF